jgi:aerobic-type carbon monoxide dehydrogenase small subunit (CoxS/CutS family)
MRFATTINGQAREIDCEPGASLHDVLRGLGITSVKHGCDNEGACGACTVLLDGEAVLSCLTPAPKAAGRQVSTVESLGNPSHPHPIQKAFVAAGAIQCGFCAPGMILATKALLDRNPSPSDVQIAEALSNNLCRCTGYVKIFEGVRNAAAALRVEAARGRE